MATWVVRSKTCPCSQGYGSRHCAIPKQRYHTLVSLGLVAEALFPEGSSQKDKLHLEIEFPGRSKEEV
jgi:hypothetical protein